MRWRDWAATAQDFVALARLNTAQYPDAPLTAEGAKRNWALTSSGRPFLLRFALEEGREVALVESYPQGDGVFLLELIAPGEALAKHGPELLDHARHWANKHPVYSVIPPGNRRRANSMSGTLKVPSPSSRVSQLFHNCSTGILITPRGRGAGP